MSEIYDLLGELVQELNKSFGCGFIIHPGTPEHPRGFLQVPSYWQLSLIHEYWNQVLHFEKWAEWRYWYLISKCQYGCEYSDLRLYSTGGRYLTVRNAPKTEGVILEVPPGLDALVNLIDYEIWEKMATLSPSYGVKNTF